MNVEWVDRQRFQLYPPVKGQAVLLTTIHETADRSPAWQVRDTMLQPVMEITPDVQCLITEDETPVDNLPWE
jgi:hypothetical protein